MADLITLGVVVVVGYYLFTTGTIDKIFGGLAAGGGGGSQYSTAAGGYNPGTSRSYKAPSGGYSRGSGGGYQGSPGWYTSGPNTGNAGHHHCVKGQPDCWCTDPRKCVAQGVPPGPGQCRPEFGTKEYLGGGQYPSQSQLPQQIALCPPGTHA